jgi:hypothetical protein
LIFAGNIAQVGEKCIESMIGKHKKRDYKEDLDVDEIIILKWIFEK